MEKIDQSAAVIIFDPEGHANEALCDAFGSFYQKNLIIDDWAPDQDLPIYAIAFTGVPDIPGAILFSDALSKVRNSPKAVWGIDEVSKFVSTSPREIFKSIEAGYFPNSIIIKKDSGDIKAVWKITDIDAWVATRETVAANQIFCSKCKFVSQEKTSILSCIAAPSFIDPIKGKDLMSCQIARRLDGPCGFDGKLFSPTDLANLN